MGIRVPGVRFIVKRVSDLILRPVKELERTGISCASSQATISPAVPPSSKP